MKTLIDENLPLKVAPALREIGHEADSVHTLQKLGIENGALYRLACEEYDMCFTRDHGFAHNIRRGSAPQRLRLIQVTLPQKPQDKFVADFIFEFSDTDWETIPLRSCWP